MAKTLVAILERCGIRQAEIARTLNVSRATVSRWASGEHKARPDQEARLLEWAHRQQLTAMVAAETHDQAVTGRTLLDANPSTAALLKDDLRGLWANYTAESQPERFDASILRILQRWGAYSQDLSPGLFQPKAAEVDQLWEDTRHVRVWVQTWRRLHHPRTEGNDHGA